MNNLLLFCKIKILTFIMKKNSVLLPDFFSFFFLVATIDSKPKCKPEIEVYSNCTNSCPANCEDPIRKPCRQYCWEGCECAEGYVKNYKWECIPREQCTSMRVLFEIQFYLLSLSLSLSLLSFSLSQSIFSPSFDLSNSICFSVFHRVRRE